MKGNMRLARRVLMAAAGVFGVIGLGCLIAPAALLGTVDVELPTATARVEIYAWYGGLELGIAAFLALCASRGDWVRLGLTASSLMLGGLGLARLLGALALTGTHWIHYPLAAAELGGAALCIWASRRVPNPRSPLWF